MENPVLRREFMTNLRTSKAAFMGGAFVVLLSFLVLFMWPASGAVSLSAQSSREMFILLSMGLLALVTMIAPAFTAVSITMEKERETFQLLYHTMLTSSQIVLGKMAAGIGFAMILVVMSLPMMGACFILGGVDLGDVCFVYAILLLGAVYFGLIGMACSAYTRSSFTAIVMSYVVILVSCGLVWVPAVVIKRWPLVQHISHCVRGLSPFAAMLSVVNGDIFVAEHGGMRDVFGEFADSAWPFVILAVVGSVVLLALNFWLVARPPQPRRRSDETLIDDPGEALKHRLGFPFYLFDPRRRKRMIGPIINVVAVKEMRSKAFGRIWWVIRAVYVSLIASFVLAFFPLTQQGYVPNTTILLLCISVPIGVILLVGPILTSSSISDERNSGVFDSLRMTELSPVTIVLGKLEVSWFYVGLLLLSTFPTFFIIGYLSSPPSEMAKIAECIGHLRKAEFAALFGKFGEMEFTAFAGIARAGAVAVADIVFATTVGICASSFIRKSSASTAVSYAVVFAIGIGTLLPYFLSQNLPGWLVEMFVTLNPFAAAGKAGSGQVFTQFSSDMWLRHCGYLTAVSAVLFAVTSVRVWLLMRPGR